MEVVITVLGDKKLYMVNKLNLIFHWIFCIFGHVLEFLRLFYSFLLFLRYYIKTIFCSHWKRFYFGQFALAHFLVSLVVNLLQVIVTLVFTIAVFQVRKIILNKKKILWCFLFLLIFVLFCWCITEKWTQPLTLQYKQKRYFFENNIFTK